MKTCTICGWKGKHPRTVTINCSEWPALRALVRAAEKCEREWDPKLGEVGMTDGDKALHRAVRRFQKERGK